LQNLTRSIVIFKRSIIFFIPVLLIAAGCSGSSSTEEVGESMSAQAGDLVELHYVLTLADGSKVDSSRDRGVPFSFTVGGGRVIAGFDIAVTGSSVGEVKTVDIQPADGYGEWNPELVAELPIAPSQADVAVGDVVFINNGQPAEVLEIIGDTVKVDANHELAGEVSTFEIEILSITRG